jgi:hypothetical protein
MLFCIFTLWADAADPAPAQNPPLLAGSVRLVQPQAPGALAWPTLPAGNTNGIEHRLQLRAVGHLPCRDHQRERAGFRICTQVGLARLTAAALAQPLRLQPPLVCWEWDTARQSVAPLVLKTVKKLASSCCCLQPKPEQLPEL